MPVFKEKDVQGKEAFPGVTLAVGISADNGSKDATMGKITMKPGSEIPAHTHPVSDCMVVIQGKGQAYTEEGFVPIEAGCQLFAPAGSPHGLKNTGNEPLVIIFTWPGINVPRTLVE